MDALATFILGRIKDSLIAQWWKFLFQLLFSGFVSFCFVTGGSLVSNFDTAASIGFGMIACAGAMVVLFVNEGNRLTKGMIVVMPKKEVLQELESNFQQIQEQKGKK